MGDRGEQIVYDYELGKVQELGRPASCVRWHSREGETPGWDISSVDELGQLIRIEVKSSVGPSISSLIMSANEWKAAREYGTAYCVYIVTDALKQQSSIEIIRDPALCILEGTLRLELAAVLVGLVPDDEDPHSAVKDLLIEPSARPQAR